MKTGILAISLPAAVFVCAAEAQQAGRSQWTGVWESTLDGQTGEVLTLGGDTGQLGGTLVLNMIVKDGGRPRVLVSEPHVLIDPRVERNTLSFSVKRDPWPASAANFAVTLVS